MAKKKYNLDSFVGNLVEIVTTAQLTSVQESMEGVSEKSSPFVINGIFLDHDDDNVYVGDEEGAMSDSISKSQIVNIGIAKTVDKFDAILDAAEDRSGSYN